MYRDDPIILARRFGYYAPRHRDLVYTALIMVLTSFGFRFRVAAVRVLRVAIVALKGTLIIYSRTGMHEVNCGRDGLIGRTGDLKGLSH
jgi:hypothetical protein